MINVMETEFRTELVEVRKLHAVMRHMFHLITPLLQLLTDVYPRVVLPVEETTKGTA